MDIKEFQNKFGIIGKSKEIKDLISIVMQVAKTDISILIFGESGTGKEVFASAVHGYSNRSSEKLVSVNCGAIPEGILESELFGHKKGSFTGAVDDRKGYFEIADNGTLFLDEIAEMSLTTQVKLLRVLETGNIMPIGSELIKRTDVRIIAATNKDLQEEVNAKRFRYDLYFRLKAVSLNIPPLRKRKEDIPLLIDFFIHDYLNRNESRKISVSEDAYDLLMTYNWPGNIRELKNVVESAIALNNTGRLEKKDFQQHLSFNYKTEEEKYLPVHLNRPSEVLDREMIFSALVEIKRDLIDLKKLAYEATSNNEKEYQPANVTEIKSLNELEKEAIRNTLKYTKWHKKRAAELLGISERTLHRKIKEYDL